MTGRDNVKSTQELSKSPFRSDYPSSGSFLSIYGVTIFSFIKA